MPNILAANVNLSVQSSSHKFGRDTSKSRDFLQIRRSVDKMLLNKVFYQPKCPTAQ